jgi:hypothetical protein
MRLQDMVSDFQQFCNVSWVDYRNCFMLPYDLVSYFVYDGPFDAINCNMLCARMLTKNNTICLVIFLTVYF